MRKKTHFFIVLVTAFIFISSCQKHAAIKINFRPDPERKPVIDTPAGIPIPFGIAFKGFALPCDGKTWTFTIRNVSDSIGILSVNNLFGKDDCQLTVKVDLCPQCDAKLKDRVLKPGESLTEIIEMNGHTDFKVQFTCSGTKNTKCIFKFDYSGGKKFKPKEFPKTGEEIKTIDGNPEGDKYFEPQGTNQCTSKLTLLKTLYLNHDKTATPLKIWFAAKSLCTCKVFNVYVSTDSNGDQRPQVTDSDKQGEEGGFIEIKEKLVKENDILYFFGECNGPNKDVPCHGDVLIKIKGK